MNSQRTEVQSAPMDCLGLHPFAISSLARQICWKPTVSKAVPVQRTHAARLQGESCRWRRGQHSLLVSDDIGILWLWRYRFRIAISSEDSMIMVIYDLASRLPSVISYEVWWRTESGLYGYNSQFPPGVTLPQNHEQSVAQSCWPNTRRVQLLLSR